MSIEKYFLELGEACKKLDNISFEELWDLKTKLLLFLTSYVSKK